MTRLKTKLIRAMLVCGLATTSMFAPSAHAQQEKSQPAPGAVANGPVVTTDHSLTVEHDKLRTSAEHVYNSPAERANDDLLITEVKSSLAERGISDRYPVEVDCDHGTIQLSGVVASADDARDAAAIALNTRGVVGVKNKLTWR
jgi:hypothetical protein